MLSQKCAASSGNNAIVQTQTSTIRYALNDNIGFQFIVNRIISVTYIQIER